MICALLLVVFVYDRVIGNVWIIDGETNSSLYEFSALSSAFGSQVKNEGIMGYLYLSDPIEACDFIASPNSSSQPYGYEPIVLIQRSPESSRINCFFERKVYHAQLAGFSAAIVFNDRGDDLISMQSSGSVPEDIQIPSVFVGFHSAAILKRHLWQSSNALPIIIRREENKSFKYYLIPFVCIIVLALSLLVMIMIVRFATRLRRERANRLPRSALKNIPVKRYCKGICEDVVSNILGSNDEDYDTCAICLDDYIEGAKIRVLFCGHMYHTKCIDPWLLYNKRTCPVCKRKVLRHPDDSDSSSDDDCSETAPLILNQISPLSSRASMASGDYIDVSDRIVGRDADRVRRLFFVGSVDMEDNRNSSTEENDEINEGSMKSSPEDSIV